MGAVLWSGVAKAVKANTIIPITNVISLVICSEFGTDTKVRNENSNKNSNEKHPNLVVYLFKKSFFSVLASFVKLIFFKLTVFNNLVTLFQRHIRSWEL